MEDVLSKNIHKTHGYYMFIESASRSPPGHNQELCFFCFPPRTILRYLHPTQMLNCRSMKAGKQHADYTNMSNVQSVKTVGNFGANRQLLALLEKHL